MRQSADYAVPTGHSMRWARSTSSRPCRIPRADARRARGDRGRRGARRPHPELAADGDVETQALWRYVRGRTLARRGAFDDAEAIAREALALLEPTDATMMKLDGQLALGEILDAAGRASDAREAYEAAHALAERKGGVVILSTVLRHLGRRHHPRVVGSSSERPRAVRLRRRDDRPDLGALGSEERGIRGSRVARRVSHRRPRRGRPRRYATPLCRAALEQAYSNTYVELRRGRSRAQRIACDRRSRRGPRCRRPSYAGSLPNSVNSVRYPRGSGPRHVDEGRRSLVDDGLSSLRRLSWCAGSALDPSGRCSRSRPRGRRPPCAPPLPTLSESPSIGT